MSEKEFNRYYGYCQIRERLRQKYNYDRSIFDRELRKAERKYNQNMLEKLEIICTDNPRECGAQMKRLGPRKVNIIPMKFYDINGNITTDIRNILHEWKINFEGLLNRPVDARFNDVFYYDCLHDKNNTESENFASNQELNFPITTNEVESFVSKLGDKKATGLDSIPNFVLKNKDVIKILY